MSFQATVTQAIAVLVGLILVASLLRRAGVVSADQSSLFSRLVTMVTLPALIFTSLCKHALSRDQVLLALFMMGAEIVCIVLADLAGRAMRLSRQRRGSLVLLLVG